MIFSILQGLLLIVIGIGSGMLVGTGIVAFLLVLDVIPRSIQLSKSRNLIPQYEGAIIAGTLLFTILDFTHPTLPSIAMVKYVLLIILGSFMGIFVGMLAAALTEILNVIPIMARRIGMDGHLIPFLMALALGKVLGSLTQWIFNIP
ncbi:stage V sporulation protein AB [Rubeoparvulum massiliense]|uniref:stage V sporulation protein AB n=1 Tax=Rubeoparvulum massiliense TaxID=1631346 RepID=UPI00065E9546|nr:stage V sporulation protein AB [Rubeoparvulum massiliense]